MNKMSTTLALFVLLSCSSVAFSQSWTMRTFDSAGLSQAPGCTGVYVIYKDGNAYYVGRSKNVYRRLGEHLAGRGSRMIAGILDKGYKLEYEYECLDSPEQAEAQLIKELGTYTAGNLRRETDPADWET